MMEDATLYPQPRRVFPPPSSPGEEHGTRSPAYGHDLRELLYNCGTPAGVVVPGAKDDATQVGYERPGSGGPFDAHPDRRPLSELSTSAGATPSPDGRASPHPWPNTPDSQQTAASPHGGVLRGLRGNAGGGFANGSANRHRGGCGVVKESSVDVLGFSPGSSGGGPPRQAGKVFVGGVPQDMSQDDLYTIFSDYGGVKKAWLQSYRTAGRINQSPPHNHRGFGFVIFYDGSSVDQLLGKSFSRYLPLTDGRRLEVKRAVPSSDLPGKPVAASGPTGPESRGNRSRGGGGGQEPVLRGCSGGSGSAGSPTPLPALPGPLAGQGHQQPLALPLQQAGAYQLHGAQQLAGAGWANCSAGAYHVHPSPQLPGSGSWAGGAGPAQVHGAPATAQWPSDPRVASPWPPYMAQQPQAMTMPQGMQQTQMQTGMMMAPVPYPGSYGAFAPQALHGLQQPVTQQAVPLLHQQMVPQQALHHQQHGQQPGGT